MSKKILINNITLPFTAPPEEACAKASEIIGGSYKILRSYIYRKSIDARHKNNICFVYSVIAEIEYDKEIRGFKSINTDNTLKFDFTSENYEKLETPPVIVGFGPCGMFCALVLAEYGYNPVVIERGGGIDERIEKAQNFYNTGILDSDTNIQFGAGGAGTFSDGKLTTRINDEKCGYILERFHQLGAPSDILTDAKPHIGTDIVRKIVKNIGARIIESGGHLYLNTKLLKIKYNGNRAYAAITDKGEFPCGSLTLAAGHSARELYDLYKADGYDIIKKPFSVGVRIEHLRTDIDKAVYGNNAGNPLLGAADYAFSKRIGEEAVYTFCMCPGGEVIAAASEENGVVVNGMSYRNRGGANSNAALVVSVTPDDPVGFQRSLEKAAFKAGGGNYAAPVQTVGDYMNNILINKPKMVKPTYMNGNYNIYDLNKIFPVHINEMLKAGIDDFGKKLKGFAAADSILTGVETRTSAPYRIKRNEDYTAIGFDNIYPCGEGAGYAGGIMSAAVDGVNCALKIMERYRVRI